MIPKEGNPRGCQGENKQTLALLFPGEMSAGTGLSPGLWSRVPESQSPASAAPWGPPVMSLFLHVCSGRENPSRALGGRGLGGSGCRACPQQVGNSGPCYPRLWEPCYSEHEHLRIRIARQASRQPPCSPPLFQPSHLP